MQANGLMDTYKLIQLTDLHLQADPQAKLRGVCCQQSLDDVLDHLQRHHSDFDLMVLTGDLTHDELPQTYHRLRELLHDWLDRIVLIPGNHDSRAAIKLAFSGIVGPALQSRTAESVNAESINFERQLGDWLLVGLDTLQPGSTAGRLGSSQIEWLDQRLAQHGERPSLVFLHHPAVSVQCRWLDAIGLEDADQLLQVLDQRPHVRAVVSGHIHQDFRTERGPIEHLATPATAVQFVPETDKPEYEALPPGYRVIQLNGCEWVTRIERIDAERAQVPENA